MFQVALTKMDLLLVNTAHFVNQVVRVFQSLSHTVPRLRQPKLQPAPTLALMFNFIIGDHLMKKKHVIVNVKFLRRRVFFYVCKNLF